MIHTDYIVIVDMLKIVQEKLLVLNYSQSHHEALGKANKNTWQWLFEGEVFQEWSKQGANQVSLTKTKAILGQGLPGVGKTCLV